MPLISRLRTRMTLRRSLSRPSTAAEGLPILREELQLPAGEVLPKHVRVVTIGLRELALGVANQTQDYVGLHPLNVFLVSQVCRDPGRERGEPTPLESSFRSASRLPPRRAETREVSSVVSVRPRRVATSDAAAYGIAFLPL